MDAVSLTPKLFTEYIELVKQFGGLVSVWPSATVDLMQFFWKSINSCLRVHWRSRKKKAGGAEQLETLNRAASLLEEVILTVRQENVPLTVKNLRNALMFQFTGKAIGKSTLYFEQVEE